jgi:pyrroline-5-carboxylate reductase
MIESMADGGVAAGLPRDTALALAAKTVAGAAAMVLRGEDESSILGLTHPGILKDKVASPAGTTIAGIMALEKAGARGAVMSAVVAAAKRSEELAG